MWTTFKVIGFGLLTAVSIVALVILSTIMIVFVGFRSNAVFPVECGLVFGAAISGRNTAGPAIVRRVDGAAELWKDGSVQTLILSGGKGDAWRLSEAAVMRQQAICSGVDGRAILLEDTARSTKENLEHSKAIADAHCESVVAISDQYHLARIRMLAKKTGWGELRAYGVEARPERGEAKSIFREVGAYLYYAFGLHNVAELDAYDDGTQETENDL